MSTLVTHHIFFESVIDIISKMHSRTVGSNKLFEKYTDILQRLGGAIDIYENSLEQLRAAWILRTSKT